MNDFEIFTCSVYNALGVGHTNAQTRRQLCQKLQCGDRTLRRAIEALRRDYAILFPKRRKKAGKRRNNGSGGRAAASRVLKPRRPVL